MFSFRFSFLLIFFLILGCSAEGVNGNPDPSTSDEVCTTTPTLKTEEASEITDTTVKLKGSITAPTCESTVTSQGFVYSLNTLPKIDDIVIELNGVNISVTATNLSPNTNYYCRTFFTNPTGTYYGNEVTFSTSIGGIGITTFPIKEISYNGAICGGNITQDGGSDITARGVCWNTTSNPTINDSKSENGSGLGGFTSEISELMLNKTLYVRAYATNGAGTTYGQEETITIESQTYVPDELFESVLINLGYDFVMDNYVYTPYINTVTELDVNGSSITDLSGIEDFSSLKELNCAVNNLTSLDISNNTALESLFCIENPLSSLDISNNTDLTFLYCGYDNVTSLDVSNNTALTFLVCNNSQISNLDVSKNLLLEVLDCSRNNNIVSFDVSNNTALLTLVCSGNESLTKLNIKNGFPEQFTGIALIGNPLLTCIQVDDPVLWESRWNEVDPWASFSEDCGY